MLGLTGTKNVNLHCLSSVNPLELILIRTTDFMRRRLKCDRGIKNLIPNLPCRISEESGEFNFTCTSVRNSTPGKN